MTAFVCSAIFPAMRMYSLFAITFIGRPRKDFTRSMGIAETPTPPKQMKSTHDRMQPTAMTYTGNVVRTDHVSVGTPPSASHA